MINAKFKLTIVFVRLMDRKNETPGGVKSIIFLDKFSRAPLDVGRKDLMI